MTGAEWTLFFFGVSFGSLLTGGLAVIWWQDKGNHDRHSD